MPQQVVHIADKRNQACIVVKCDDTDVFLLLAYVYHTQKLKCVLQMEGTSPTRASIDIGATVKQHSDIILYLLAAHALSGCDTVACIFGIGKATVVQNLLKGYKLEKLGNIDED